VLIPLASVSFNHRKHYVKTHGKEFESVYLTPMCLTHEFFLSPRMKIQQSPAFFLYL